MGFTLSRKFASFMKTQIDTDLQAHVGRTLIKVQIFEFLIHGIVAHFKPSILSKY